MMIRSFSVVLGIGLVVMWIAGLSTLNSPTWMNWLDLVAAIGAFVVAGAVNESRASRFDSSSPVPCNPSAFSFYGLWG